MHCYPTLWNMFSRNRHAQELHEQTTTHARFSDWKLLSKNTHIMMWAICNLLTRRYLPNNPQNNILYAAAATKKDFTAKSFRASSTFSHSLWWCQNASQNRFTPVSGEVKWVGFIFDIYVGKVEINIKTVNNSHTQDIHFFGTQCRSNYQLRCKGGLSFQKLL